MKTAAYQRLKRRFGTIFDLEAAAATIEWYSRCYGPKGGATSRGSQIATLKEQAHKLLVNPECKEDLEQAEVEDVWHSANLREMRCEYRRQAGIPVDLVKAEAEAASNALAVWETAKPNGDFAAFLPAFSELLARVRERAAVQGETLGMSPSDALLDGHDANRQTIDIDRMFAELEAVLPDMIDRARRSSVPSGPSCSKMQLERISKRMMKMLDLGDNHVRLDESSHPFTTGVPDDVRITTRYAGRPTDTLMAVLHEGGHAIYARNLPLLQGSFRQPVCMDRGLTVHESQSLSIEMFACRTRPFAKFLSRMIAEECGGHDGWTPERLYSLFSHVEPGFIRVNADELTYQLHIAVRFRCENALMNRTLDVEDLPDAFGDSMESLLGIRPANPREGCLQDIHWASADGWGYFPTYTLGALMAAQITECMESALPDLEDEIAQGNFGPMISWLKDNVHSRGRLDASSDNLLEHVTGRPLGTEAFLRRMQRKYADP